MSYLYQFKLITIGDSSVGKSCILRQFLQNYYITDHKITIGVEFGARFIQVGGRKINLQIWDTVYCSPVTRVYYRKTIGCILVYDITNRRTFQNLCRWLEEITNYGNENISLILVGNKTDLHARRAVSKEEGAEFARKHKLLFCECSAKERLKIDEIFEQLSESICNKIERKEIEPKESIGIKLGAQQFVATKKENKAKDKKKCQC